MQTSKPRHAIFYWLGFCSLADLIVSYPYPPATGAATTPPVVAAGYETRYFRLQIGQGDMDQAIGVSNSCCNFHMGWVLLLLLESLCT